MGFRLGDMEFKHGIVLAPMAGYTDRAFRVIAKECGAEMSVTEMVSAKACCFGDEKTKRLARIMPDEGRVALQLFGNDKEAISRAAEILSSPVSEGAAAPVAIDINMGCPVNKIFSNGEGSALMRDPCKIFDIVKATKSAIPLPLSVKLRLGIDEEHINVVECALAAEEAGADLITVHGRTRKQMYAGVADREAIARVKEAVRLPLVANGDIDTVKSALDMFRVTKADGIAIGRGAVGNPYLFREIALALEGEEYISPDISERCDLALRQLKIAIEEKGETTAVLEARKQIALYLHGFSGAARLRAEINSALTYGEVEKIMAEMVRQK